MPVSNRLKPPGTRHTTVVSSFRDLVALAAESRLLKSRYSELQRVSCKFHEGVLTLRGTVSHCYLKHVAEEFVSHVTGVMEIDNRLRVLPRGTESETRQAEVRGGQRVAETVCG